VEPIIGRLLTSVWGKRSGYVFLPHKDAPELGRSWHETDAIPYNGEPPSLDDLPSKADLYFCPVVFSEPQRRKENALPTNVLWSDLDPVHPNSCRLKPSIAWESSPGRYQALWFLTEEIPPEEAASLSKRIAYADGGDKGGWDLTQVLRIPGTKNFKYDSTPPGRLLWAKRNAYSPTEIRSTYPPVNGEAASGSITESEWPNLQENQIQLALIALPVGLKKRLSQSTAGADRSLELQKLARDLLKWGLDSGIVLNLLQRSSWNKFAGRQDEKSQLMSQVSSAQDAVERERTHELKNGTTTLVPADAIASTTRQDELSLKPLEEMRIHRWTEFLSIPSYLRWLVEDSWVDGTVGFISGRSKSYKTWIALDLAFSILSGAPFLGLYPIGRTGPVLLIQEEDPQMILQERMRLIAKAKDMLPQVTFDVAKQSLRLNFREYPLYIINLQGFSLTSEDKVAQVRRAIARINPVMVVIDPLINVLGSVDEHRATEIAGVLQSVKMWREEFGCNVCIVHHWNKTKTEDGDRGGAHMYGSFQFHAWLESALHVEPVIDPDADRIDTVVVEKEFKAAPSTARALKLKFDIDTKTDFHYDVKFEGASDTPMAQTLLDVLSQTGDWITGPDLVSVTGFSRSKVVETLGSLARHGKIEVQRGGGRGKSSQFRIKPQ
jgi:RecA-family ATPase/biotin operon repressor